MIGRRSLLVGLTLAGCASPNPKLYTLLSKPGAVIVGPAGIVAIRAPVLPRYVERREIIRRDSVDQMRAFDNDWWSEPLAEMVRRLLVADLTQRLPAAAVLGDASVAGDAVTTEIEVELSRFDTDDEGRVMLSGFAGIAPKGLPRRLNRLRVETAFTGTSVSARVDAMSTALGQAADQIVSALMA